MGATATKLARRSPSVDSQSETWELSEDVLIHILSFVPASDLLKNCCLVCSLWNSLISGHTIWKTKCHRDGVTVPRYVFKSIPKDYYRDIYITNRYARNLLKNPFGSEKMECWEIDSSNGDGWVVEDTPNGADPVPADADGLSCFATSYGLCQKHQVIDLLKEGLRKEILDGVPKDIAVGEWHAARFDCGSWYTLKVVLQDANHSAIDVFEYGPIREEQWAGKKWTKVEHVFNDCSPGVRYVVFEHCGQDTQFWAGHYGSKMTGGYVKFVWK